MRTVKNLLWFGVGVLLSVVACFSYAETAPAVQKTRFGYYRGGTYVYDVADDALTACNLGQAAWRAANNVGASTFGQCTAVEGNVNAQSQGACTCSGSASVQSGWVKTSVVSCPSSGGWTLQGASCTRPDCNPDETRQPDGSCVNKCASLAGTSNSFWTGQQYCGKGSQPATVCESGCAMALGGVSVSFGSEWCSSVGNYTGASCGLDSPVGTGESDGKVDPEGEKLPPDSPEKKCVDAGKGFGSVNGVVICVDPDTTTGKKEETIKNKNPQGETTSESTQKTETKTIKNPDGSTTTITTVTNSDGSKTETTKTTSGSANGGGGNGNGDGDFGWGEPGEEGALTEKEAGASSLTPVEIAGGASCPLPVSLPHGWGEVRYDLACSLADKVRPIVLAFAWLAAGLIVIGGVKGD